MRRQEDKKTRRQEAHDDYSALFRRNVLRSLQVVLTQAEQETTPTLSATLRMRTVAALEYAFQVPDSWPTLRLLLRRLTPRFNLAGAWAEWAPYLEKGLAVDAAQEDGATRAAFLADLGLLNQRLNRLELADAQLREAADLAGRQGDHELLGLALQRRAEIARLERRYADCTTLLAAANALFAPDATAQAPGLFVAGKAAFDQHDLTAATAAFTQAMTLWQAIGDQAFTALCIQNLGRIAARSDPLAAIPLYEKAISLLIAAGDLSNLPVVQMNLGIAYYENRQYEQALSLFYKVKAHFQAMSDHRYLAMTYNNLGIIYTTLYGWVEAEVNFQHSIRLYQQLNDNKAWISAKGNLGIAYLEQTRYLRAIETFQEALTELQATTHDPEYDRLWRELTKYLTQAQEGHRERQKR